jgi:hypothetical protein
MKFMPADARLDTVFLPEYPEGRGDLFRAFGLADAIFPGRGRGLEQHVKWFTVYVEER